MKPEHGTEAQTLFDILWSRHEIRRNASGKALLYFDRAVVDDVRAPFIFANIQKRGLSVRRPELVLIVQDHAVTTFPATAPANANRFAEATRNAARALGIRLIDISDPEQGISHVVAPEIGFALPGATYISVDSHAPTVGGIGALGFGCGSTEMEHVLATQTAWMHRPRQARIKMNGSIRQGTTAKDIVLYALARLGRHTLRGTALEFSGSVSQIPVEGRMTLCNMAVEMGARTALVAPDEKVLAWLEPRIGSRVTQYLLQQNAFSSLATGDEAKFDSELSIDCPQIVPQITWGTNPSQAIAIDGTVPGLMETEDASAARHACEYMGVSAGEPLLGRTIDWVFIGSCTNARFEDLASAAGILKGRRVRDGVRAIVVPGSRSVERQAEATGVREIFLASGFTWGEPGCSMCAGGGGENVPPNARVISTTNRNFDNRQGFGVRTHLASPLTAAAAAVTGHISDPRQLLTQNGGL